VDAFPTEVFHGRISTIRLNATTVQNVVTYNTVIDLKAPDCKLLPGETAYSPIPTGQVGDVVRVPNAAIRFTPTVPADELKRLYQQNGISLAAAASRSGAAKVVWQAGPG